MNLPYDWLVISDLDLQLFTNHILLISIIINSILHLQFLPYDLGEFEGDKKIKQGISHMVQQIPL